MSKPPPHVAPDCSQATPPHRDVWEAASEQWWKDEEEHQRPSMTRWTLAALIGGAAFWLGVAWLVWWEF